MKIIIDIGGCDYPDKMILGVCNAAKAHPDYQMVLVGDKEFIEQHLDKTVNNVIIEHAPDIITNEDSPTRAIRQKPNSSLVRAISVLNESDDAIGFISGGSTGAVLTASTLLIGRIKGVHRAVLASLMPCAVDGKLVCIADCGANVDCNPEFLPQFALMAHYYIKAVFGIENPTVGLLSNGAEDKKGDERTKAAFPLIKALPINFVGNMEARYAMSGDYDIIVCDGFAGNVLVKSVEGTAKTVMKLVKQAMTSSFKAKMGALLLKKSITALKDKMDYHAYGGAAFLGLNKPVIKTHGSSNEVSTAASVNNLIRMHEHNTVEEIRIGISAIEAAAEAPSEGEKQ
ncbi:MAG: phosphate acyltransferase PlsX [Clostridiales bacterium]|nr:phosphate acyltransferase PlsX [Clostridiales bacterium]